MSVNFKGIKRDAQLDRRHLLAANEAKIREAMQGAQGSTMADPVGFIVDVNDLQGGNFATCMYQAEGLTKDAARKMIADIGAEYRRKAIPTLLAVVPMASARVLLPCSSPTASETLAQWEQGRQPGQYLVVVMASGGNTYASITL